MKVNKAIEILSKLDQNAELMWHDAIEGNDCPVVSFCPITKNCEVFVSPIREDELRKLFGIIEKPHDK